jgi:hypothetical protein
MHIDAYECGTGSNLQIFRAYATPFAYLSRSDGLHLTAADSGPCVARLGPAIGPETGTEIGTEIGPATGFGESGSQRAPSAATG